MVMNGPKHGRFCRSRVHGNMAAIPAMTTIRHGSTDMTAACPTISGFSRGSRVHPIGQGRSGLCGNRAHRRGHRRKGSASLPCVPDDEHQGADQSALVDEWVTAVGLRSEDYGAQSLRRTKASIVYKATGNLRAVQILLGHTKVENTVRYLGVDVENALTLAEGIEV